MCVCVQYMHAYIITCIHSIVIMLYTHFCIGVCSHKAQVFALFKESFAFLKPRRFATPRSFARPFSFYHHQVRARSHLSLTLTYSLILSLFLLKYRDVCLFKQRYMKVICRLESAHMLSEVVTCIRMSGAAPESIYMQAYYKYKYVRIHHAYKPRQNSRKNDLVSEGHGQAGSWRGQ